MKKATVRLLTAILFILLCHTVFSQDIKTNYFYALPGAEESRINDEVRLEITVQDAHRVMIVAICNKPEAIEYLELSLLEDSAKTLLTYSAYDSSPEKYKYAFLCEEKDLEKVMHNGMIDLGVFYKKKDTEEGNSFGLTAKLN